jgi:hypothetical protein
MKDQCKSEDSRAQGSEKALKSVYFPSQSFPLLASVKTCPINAPQRIFPKHLILEYPPQIRGIGGPDDFQNDSLCRCRPHGHRCTHGKSRTRTVSSYGEAAWLRPRDYDLLLESHGLLQGLPVMAQRSPQSLSPVRRYQVRPVFRILVQEEEWNIALVPAQSQGIREWKNTTILVCDPNATTASPMRFIHQNVPCGNDGIVENSFIRNPCYQLEKFTRRSFKQSLEKPCSVYVNSNRPERTVGKPKLHFLSRRVSHITTRPATTVF